MLNELACFYRDLGKLDKSVEMFQKAEFEMRDSTITKTLNYVQIIINKADTYRIMGEHEKALGEFNRAERLIKKIAPNDYYSFASLYNSTALVYQDLRDCDKEIEFLEKAKNLLN